LSANKGRAYFGIVGYHFNPDVVTQLLGLEPTSTNDAGTRGTLDKPVVSSWEFSTPTITSETQEIDIYKLIDDEILKKIDINPKVMDETCCGMPFAVLGYKDELAKHKEEFRRQFPQKEFICLCTTCAFFINKAYPDLKPKYVIETIAEKLPNYNPKELGLKVTYHDPCNVARGMGMVDEPREILKQIGVELIEMETNGKQAECCGGGGGVLVTDKSLAERLADKRMNQAIETGVDTLVTLCPTCEINIRNASNRNGGKLEVKNVLDLVWEAICHK